MELARAAGSQRETIPKSELSAEDKSIMADMKYAQGLGASIRYANELRAVKQPPGRLFLKSSNLHDDVLKNKLGPGNVRLFK